MITCPSCGRENPDGSRFCNACGTALAAAAPAGGEERKTVTIVFVDLVGFTAQAEQLDPEDVQQVLSPYHARVRAELERHGGTVEKFIGDAVMAVFGAPAAHEDDPERAVRAALAIRDWAQEQPALQVRIAVNTGEALVRVGARQAEGEGMVAGDVVNTAARMQAAAPVNGILVGESTHRATQEAIELREADPVHGKGKAEPIRVWEALDAVGRFGVDLARRPKSPLVGRERELELLRSLLGRVRQERSAQLVTLVGVPGIGKSRLVGELFRHAEGEEELIRWRQGRCIPYGESITFWALGEIVKAEAGILETDPPEEAQRKLARAVERLVQDDEEARWVEGELRALVGLVGDGRQSAAESATAAWRRFLDAAAEDGPTVLVFEDLHWADDGLLDFLTDLVDWLRTAPLLVVATARPELLERRRSWGGGQPNATTISLQPLNVEETTQLISSLLAQPLQLADDRQALLERAGGNPLFAEQYVRMLGERGTTVELPESVQGVIAARLDGLPRPEKELLQDAAVHGKVFWRGAVTAGGGVGPTEADELLRALERKDFVVRERRSAVAGDTQYAFRHVLLRDVAYGQIPRRARADKHRRAAAWIEGLGRPDDHAELLAYHYKEALTLDRAAGVEDDPQLVERARGALLAAGERALSLSAYDASAAFFAEALELLSAGDPARPALLVRRARALMPVGGPGVELLDEAIPAFEAAGDVDGMAEATALAARFAWFHGDRASTDRYIARAVELLEDRPPSAAKAEVFSQQSGFHMLGGRFEDSIRIGEEGLALAEQLDLDHPRARLRIVVGTARCCLGDPGGLDEIRGGIEIAQAASDVDMMITGYANLGSELHFLGRLDEAREAWRNELALSERFEARRMLRGAKLGEAGWAYVDGDWNRGSAVVNALVSQAESGSSDYSDGPAYALRAWIRLARGDDVGAERDSARAAEVGRASDSQAKAAAFPVRAAVAIALGDLDEAGACATDLLELGPVAVVALCSPFPTLADAAWILRDLGREDELSAAILDRTPIESPWVDAARAIAAGDLAQAAETIAELGNAAATAYARYRASEQLVAAGDLEAARALRAAADEFHRAVGAHRFLAAPAARSALPGGGA
ncbi:MAG TPA: AAA family ATPase [Gaiellaceae bacterium]|nr:AAA family ATPase [Gaiellaceae bacterium]